MLQYGYANGILQQIKDSNASTIFWQANASNPRGQVTQETLGNGVVTNRAFDAVTGWVNSIQSGAGGGTAIQNESYLFDLVGNVTQRQNNNAGLTENFFYDNVYRLDHSTLGSTTNLQMGYDLTGNITSRSDIAGGAAWTYDPNKKHAVLQTGAGGYSYTYDANGNATTRNGYTIQWTSYNYPSAINSNNKNVALSYDANRQRYEQVYSNGSSIETTIYVGKLLEKVTLGSIVDWRHYIRAGNELVAIMSRQSSGTNVTHYVLSDHEGSIARMTDGSGVTTVAESFGAFGTRRDPNTWSGLPSCPDLGTIKSISREGYTGQDAIGGVSMGLNHMNGRVQDAITGRFLSPDPFGVSVTSTQSFNRYSYVENNPLTKVDPSGFDDLEHDLPYYGDNAQGSSETEDEVVVTADRNNAPAAGGDPSLSSEGGGGGGSGEGALDAIHVLGHVGVGVPSGSYVSSGGVGSGGYAVNDPEGGLVGLVSTASPAGGKGQGGLVPFLPAQIKTNQQPCSEIEADILDFTGGPSNESFIDDVVNNFVDTSHFGIDNLIDNVAGTNLTNTPYVPNPGLSTAVSAVGAGTVTSAWGGITPGQAVGAAWNAYNNTVRIPGLIGFRTPLQLVGTAGASWLAYTVALKGIYDAGLLVGSVARTGVNRLAAAACGKP